MIEMVFDSKWTENLVIATLYTVILMKKQFPQIYPLDGFRIVRLSLWVFIT